MGVVFVDVFYDLPNVFGPSVFVYVCVWGWGGGGKGVVRGGVSREMGP
jgi:hypothetical protein